MKRTWKETAEHIIDASIPYWVLILLVILIVEFGFPSTAEKYHLIIEILDWCIVTFFVLDLVFKWQHVHHVKPFLKKYWLDIIAVFPFFLLFRFFDEIRLIFRLTATEAKEAQLIFHEGLELEKATKVIREGEEVAKISRSSRFLRFIRPIARVPRLFKAIEFFNHPSERHKRKR